MPSVQDILQQQSAHIRLLKKSLGQVVGLAQSLAHDVAELRSRPRSITEEIDAIPGRRIESIFSGTVEFDANDEGIRGLPVLIPISMDGDFIQTHYPLILWRPAAPENATNFQAWRPVASYPLPTQEVTGDIIDISYEMFDAGSMREFQNEPRGPVISRPDNVVPCAVPTQWAPNAVIRIFPTYHRFLWNGEVPPTAGILYVGLIGYRIVNM